MLPNEIPFESIMIPLSAIAGLSLVVERILEFLKNVLESILGGGDHVKMPDLSQSLKNLECIKSAHLHDDYERQIENTVVKLKSRLDKESDPRKREHLMEEIHHHEKDVELKEQYANYTILIEPATEPDDSLVKKRFIIQCLGFALGIILARGSGIRLFNTLLGGSQTIPLIPFWTDSLLTGLLIGGGSGPIHVLIRFITQRKLASRTEMVTESASEDKILDPLNNPKTKAPVIIVPPSDRTLNVWKDIPYGGGIDCDKLEHVHIRNANPDLIVYHHTAMNSDSTFEDVVRVIKSHTNSKGQPWITGYNCVITSDGIIHPFCRWDRYGNHAAGNNIRSLGISFNGNYETDPSIPYSNPDGRMGLHKPTERQLRAGARVITLWSFIYGLDVDFKKVIIPHNQVSSKSCPGSTFPYEDFKKLIDFYRKKWQQSTEIQEHIEVFKVKPYLYV